MPTYRYECNKCEVVFEAISSIKDRTLGCSCPNCEGWGDYIISAPFLKAYLDSDKWVKNRESHMKQEQKNMSNHGSYK